MTCPRYHTQPFYHTHLNFVSNVLPNQRMTRATKIFTRSWKIQILTSVNCTWKTLKKKHQVFSTYTISFATCLLPEYLTHQVLEWLTPLQVTQLKWQIPL